MKKWFVMLLAIVLIGAFLVPSFAATAIKTLTPEKQKQVDALWQQMYEVRSKILQTYVDAGTITQDQADAAKARMKQMYEYRKTQGINPGSGICGTGAGCGAAGGCGMGGRGPAFRGQGTAQNANVY